MKIPVIKRLMKGDFPDSPAWFDPILNILNTFMERTVMALTGKLTFTDNFYCNIKTITITHAVEYSVTHSLANCSGAIIIFSDQTTDANKLITGQKIRIIDNKTLGVTINLAGGSGTSDIKLLILG